MITQAANTYHGQFMQKMVSSIREANGTSDDPVEFGDALKIHDSTRREFTIAIPGTEAAASGDNPVFDQIDGKSISMLHDFDSNKDGKINWRENMEMMATFSQPLNGYANTTEGRVLMRDFNSLEDLEDYLGTQFDGIFSKAEAEAMFERFDLDGDGKISESEMENAMKEIEAEAKKRIEEEIEKEKERISLSSQLAFYDEPAIK
ncbi:EF-hand domain-containing protein [Pelagicoccus sp. SDUM812002]|uniref:EF-hand domain-containing protein n=1 Tax=Pelagicoccus sp. SDUM812002 TaxID=3041266 RepID=UPI00280E1428|nr:EF-hand domain-containing protein [Pelagicoccus sp. SDUM812002]MDQ8188536.1 EF-hand domain-containing protein [Pelagicoccus sp. SDUM812002]